MSGVTSGVTPGYELPLLLFGGFRTLIDRLHQELARQGHADARPAHGFVLQAVGPAGATASELGRRLGVSKQAAGKTVDALVARGYADRTADPQDARRKIVAVTSRGRELLALSAEVFERLRADWAVRADLRGLEDALRVAPGAGRVPLDTAAWLG